MSAAAINKLKDNYDQVSCRVSIEKPRIHCTDHQFTQVEEAVKNRSSSGVTEDLLAAGATYFVCFVTPSTESA
jgi:hypothetical protein